MPEGSIFSDTFDLGGGTDLFDVGEGNLFTDDGATEDDGEQWARGVAQSLTRTITQDLVK